MSDHRPIRIVGLAGSLRAGSFNRGLIRAAVDLAPAGVTVEPFELADVPLLNEDVEAVGLPAPVAALRDAIRAADALLLATPEYNGGYTPVLKNAIDWASRKQPDNVLDGKPVALIGATPGGVGTAIAQAGLRHVLLHCGAEVMPRPQLRVPHASDLFPGGELVDRKRRDRLAAVIAALADRARLLAAGRAT